MMKWSDIFKNVLSRQEPPPDSTTSASEIDAEQDPFARADASDDAKLSDEEIAEQIEAEPTPFEPPRVPLPEIYHYPDAKESAHLHAELLRELPADHPLFGVPLETFAACDANDDTLFRYRGNPQRFVLVHLTWVGRTEIDKNHPSIVLDGTFDDFLDYANEVWRIISEQ